MINILIADDNKQLALQLAKILSQNKEFNIVDIVENGTKAVESYLELQPDIMLLDMEMPYMNGIEVIEYLSKYSVDEKAKCNIIVLTGYFKDYPLKKPAKVFQVVEKPFEVNLLVSIIYEAVEIANIGKMKSQIELVLSELKFDFSHKGTQYIKEALLTAREKKEYYHSFEGMYEILAKTYSSCPKKVRWNMENAINSVYKLNSQAPFYKVFDNYDGRKPTPKYLFYLFSSYKW